MHCRKQSLMIIHAFLIVLFAAAAFGQTKTDADTRPLIVGQAIERELKSDEAHSYTLALQAGQFLNLVVEQKGIDVVVTLFDSGNKKVAEVDSPNGRQGAEPLYMIIETTGNYRLEVRSLEKTAAAGRYEAKIVELRNATDKDKNIIAAQRAYNEGEELFALGTAESLRNAIKKYEESLPFYRAAEDLNREAAILNNIGAIYMALGENQKALEFFNQILPIFRKVDNKDGEAAVLSNLSTLYNYFGENQKALESLVLALSLTRQFSNKINEGKILTNIGKLYEALGERQKALESYNLALPIRRQVGDKKGESLTLNNIGTVYMALGENQKALEFFNQSLPIVREVGDKNGEATTLSNIGGIYLALGENQKALEFYNKVLLVAGQVSDKSREVIALSNIGRVYSKLGERQKAIDYYNQSLLLSRKVKYRSGEATALSNIGSVYFSIGEKQKALEYYNQSLPFMKQIGDKNGEAVTFENLFDILVTDNPRFGIYYGKQSVNNYQTLRLNVQKLDKNTQQTFLKSIEDTYRRLADALIKQQRYAEAQQILNAFKDQQFFDFSQSRQLVPLAVTQREAELTAILNQKLENVVAAIRANDDFNRNIGNRPPTADETAQLKSLEAKQTVANDDYLAFLKTAENEFTAAPTEKDKLPAVVDLTEMQTALRETSTATKQNTVAVYTLVGEENFHALIITSDSIKSVSTPIKNDVLNEKAKQFWALLQSPDYDPTKLGKELYDTIFKPLEKELPADTKTILWSLDGNLRYVPMAALFDGEKYLVERYNHVNFTRADKERMTRAVKSAWTATGFGTSQARTVDLLGEKISFNALPGVGEELQTIFKQDNPKFGIFDGETLQDARFTKERFLAALRQKRPVVHIASHFAFRAGDESRSFLLLGDGTAMTLDEMKRQEKLFDGVEMLTLSACNTAAQQADATGRDVDAFFELAQRLGANSVMATLWSVADNSTPALMKDFYNSKLNKNLSKAEALRQAQIALLSGSSVAKPAATRSDSSPVKIVLTAAPEKEKSAEKTRSDIIYLNEQDAPVWDKTKHAPFAHPFYWSPFVLFGNWR